MITRQVTWGEALWLELKKQTGGLAAVHKDVIAVAGAHMGVRNTFSKLCRYNSVSELDEADGLRAWLLLTALGENPEDWGISHDVLPEAFVSPRDLRERFEQIRVSRLGESNPRPIHYQVKKRARSHNLSRAAA